MDETTVTTATITAESGSKRSAQLTWRSPVSIQVKSSTVRALPPSATSKNKMTPRTAAIEERRAGDELSAAVAEPAAEEAGDEGAQKRQEDGCDRHASSPSSG